MPDVPMPDSPAMRRIIFVLGLLVAPSALAGVYDDIIAATNKDDTAQVVDLLTRGMDVNTADPAGNTLLIIAARNGNRDLLDFLLRNRANALKRNKYGDSAIMVAAFRGNAGIIKRLLDAGADAANSGWNALHYAAYGGHAEVVQMLLARPLDLDAAAPNGQTALMLAAKAGKLEVVKLLIDADADLELEDHDGKTAMDLAGAAGHGDVVEYLREEGAYE